MTLEGRVALVTGAGSGIGAAIASALAQAGATVVVSDADPEAADARAAAIGARAAARALDVTDRAQLASVEADLRGELGPVTVLVNSAGINRPAATESLSWDTWAAIVDVNLAGTFAACQRFGAAMLDAGGGAIVNVSSIHDRIAMPGRAAYAATKGAVSSLTRALAVEWAGRGVRVNALAPGFIRTPFVESALRAGVASEQGIVERTPLGRLGEPSEVADAALFLVSDQSRYITGHTLVVDGGYTAFGAPVAATTRPPSEEPRT